MVETEHVGITASEADQLGAMAPKIGDDCDDIAMRHPH
jgi:hypothetical protein